MKIRLISFTGRGQALAEDLAEKLGGEAQRCGHPLSLSEWTQAAFREADALVFVGAAGIAVRAVAPYLAGKDRDPAVVAVDETGRFAVPLLSGHLGGANDLAGRIAACCGAQAVITTATDVNGVFAADLWARHQGCAVLNVGKIKEVSSRLLSGGTVTVKSDWQIAGDPPDGVRVSENGACDVRVTARREKEGPLLVVPKILVQGSDAGRTRRRKRSNGRFWCFLRRSSFSPRRSRWLPPSTGRAKSRDFSRSAKSTGCRFGRLHRSSCRRRRGIFPPLRSFGRSRAQTTCANAVLCARGKAR